MRITVPFPLALNSTTYAWHSIKQGYGSAFGATDTIDLTAMASPSHYAIVCDALRYEVVVLDGLIRLRRESFNVRQVDVLPTAAQLFGLLFLANVWAVLAGEADVLQIAALLGGECSVNGIGRAGGALGYRRSLPVVQHHLGDGGFDAISVVNVDSFGFRIKHRTPQARVADALCITVMHGTVPLVLSRPVALPPRGPSCPLPPTHLPRRASGQLLLFPRCTGKGGRRNSLQLLVLPRRT